MTEAYQNYIKKPNNKVVVGDKVLRAPSELDDPSKSQVIRHYNKIKRMAGTNAVEEWLETRSGKQCLYLSYVVRILLHLVYTVLAIWLRFSNPDKQRGATECYATRSAEKS